MKGVILAGGRGVRLRPLTDFVAKPLLPINGRPMIEQVIEILKKAGINEICIVLGHLGEQVVDFIGDGHKLGVNITYKTQKEQLGTAHALSAVGDFIEKDILVIASDCILPVEHVKELIKFHYAKKCDATLSLKKLSVNEMLQSSTVKLEEDMSISKIIEKPSLEEILSDIACAPLYIFRDVRDYLPDVKKSRRGESEIQDILQRM
ncbi:MAG: nucleotidyltransferase family protein, partial [Candidatus Hydrothermarchaeales archaeon]